MKTQAELTPPRNRLDRRPTPSEPGAARSRHRWAVGSLALALTLAGCGSETPPEDAAASCIDCAPDSAPAQEPCSQLAALRLAPPERTLSVGQWMVIPVMGAYGQDSEAAEQALSNATLTSSDPSIGTVSEDGIVSALKVGRFSLTAHVCGVQHTAALTVIAGPTPRQTEACQSLVEDISHRTATQAMCFVRSSAPAPDCSAFKTTRDAAREVYAGCLSGGASGDCSGPLAALENTSEALLQCHTRNGPPASCGATIMAISASCTDLVALRCATGAALPPACR